MNVLAIETSCDETSIALVRINRKGNGAPSVSILKNIVSSQVKIHAPFGGVVPNLAKREHLKNLPLIWREFLKHPLVRKKDIDLLTVTVGPGLEPALWTGIEFAKGLHEAYFEKKIPLVGANHVEAHMYSFLLARAARPEFPMVSLIISGGHTILGILKDMDGFKKIGETKDDAVGECFDKVARLLDFPYPGGPEIEKAAAKGNADAIRFPSPMLYHKNYDFSYSGLKTALLYFMRGPESKKFSKSDIAASFQKAAFGVLVRKAMRACDEYKAKAVGIGGGVAGNKKIRSMLQKEFRLRKKPIRLIVPPFAYCQDNAAMIALAGYMAHARKKAYPLEADGNLGL